MPDLKFPQFARNSLHPSSHDIASARPQGGVVQEKVALTSDPKSTIQSAAGTNGVRSPHLDSHAVRLQNGNTRPRPKVPFTVHIDPLVKSDLERQAELDGISASREGADLLEEMLHQKFHQRKAATLGSVIEAIIDRKLGQRDARLARLLLRNAYAAERLLVINTNILSRMPGVTPKILDAILDRADTQARLKISKRSPRLDDILKQLEAMLAAPEGEGGAA